MFDRTLKVDCKHSLTLEGRRLAELYYEEASACVSAVNRLRFRETSLVQAGHMLEVVQLNSVDELGLMEKREEAVLAAAREDNTGDDVLERTVGGLGIKYRAGMSPTTDAVARTETALSDARERSNATKGIRRRYLDCERNSLNVSSGNIAASYAKLAAVSCLESSDFERAQQLQNFMANWLQVKATRLSELEAQMLRSNAELRLEAASLRRQNQINLDGQRTRCEQIQLTSAGVIDALQSRLVAQEAQFDEAKARLDESVLQLSRECQQLREKSIEDIRMYEDKVQLLRVIIRSLEFNAAQLSKRLEILLEEKRLLNLSHRWTIDELRTELRMERRHSSILYFIIHALRSSVHDMRSEIRRLQEHHVLALDVYKSQNRKLKKEVYKHIFCFARMSTDPTALFEFFASRLANIAGARVFLNQQLIDHRAPDVLVALCRSPSALIRRYATHSLAGLCWNSYAESRVIMWNCVRYWNEYVDGLRLDQSSAFESGFKAYANDSKLEVIAPFDGESVSDALLPKEGPLRSLLAARRQWALRFSRRRESPNLEAPRQFCDVGEAVKAVMQCVTSDGDWEVARNAALVVGVASLDEGCRVKLAGTPGCLKALVALCSRTIDAEVSCYAAVAIANIAFKDESSQRLFGDEGCIEALLSLCESQIVDLLEAATRAIANLVSACDDNCRRLLFAGGVDLVVRVVERPHSENLLDLDQNDEVLANAVEILTNVARYDCDLLADAFDERTLTSLCLLAAAANVPLKRQVALILGNLAQNERCRETICGCGGVEALVLLLEESDSSLQANVLWALSNLMWHAANQERAGRYLSAVLELTRSSMSHIRSNAFLLLANMLYYCEGNCDRLLSTEGALDMLVDHVLQDTNELIVDCCLRCLLSMTCIDDTSLALGTHDALVSRLLRLADPANLSLGASKLSLSIICNLCIHDACRRGLIRNQGIESLVSLLSHNESDVAELADRILDRVKSVAPPEVLAKMKTDVSAEVLVRFLNSDDPLVRQAASEIVGERATEGLDRSALQDLGAVEALLRMCDERLDQAVALIPGIWSLRRLLADNQRAQSQFAASDGVPTLARLLQHYSSRALDGAVGDVVEASLSCLYTAVRGDRRNARSLVHHSKALECLLQLSGDHVGKSPSRSSPHRHSSTVSSLSAGILEAVAKHNYMVCRRCLKRQDVNGLSCLGCGHRLVFEVLDKPKALRKEAKRPLSGLPSAIL